jgi:ATP-dependent protease ClpP protease subunit
MIRSLITAVTVSLAFTTCSSAAPASSNNKFSIMPIESTVKFRTDVPTFYILGAIGRGNILPAGQEILKESKKGTKEVQLVLNSPGGQIITGNLFIGMLLEAKANGTRITCFVPQLAASMAFQIFLHCDSRYALSTSYLLWHRARVSVGMGEVLTGPASMTLAKDLLDTDDAIFRDLIRYLGKHMNMGEMARHFEVETLHSAANLKQIAPDFLTVSDSIPGLLDSTIDTMTRTGSELFKRMEYRVGEIVYILPDLIKAMNPAVSETSQSK